jgi:hypothetical protein
VSNLQALRIEGRGSRRVSAGLSPRPLVRVEHRRNDRMAIALLGKRDRPGSGLIKSEKAIQNNLLPAP